MSRRCGTVALLVVGLLLTPAFISTRPCRGPLLASRTSPTPRRAAQLTPAVVRQQSGAEDFRTLFAAFALALGLYAGFAGPQLAQAKTAAEFWKAVEQDGKVATGDRSDNAIEKEILEGFKQKQQKKAAEAAEAGRRQQVIEDNKKKAKKARVEDFNAGNTGYDDLPAFMQPPKPQR
eukprot:TRINITY_DN3938_c0_g1_i1.p1 TRINITY_DN3938_c0_g1~~TRINITY_DN3938_c0_g1_i1.p1  ORF type:complete len:207 (+),score=32.67 TRINITY_DN3938_c0_g1_i1:92-622(+)